MGRPLAPVQVIDNVSVVSDGLSIRPNQNSQITAKQQFVRQLMTCFDGNIVLVPLKLATGVLFPIRGIESAYHFWPFR